MNIRKKWKRKLIDDLCRAQGDLARLLKEKNQDCESIRRSIEILQANKRIIMSNNFKRDDSQ